MNDKLKNFLLGFMFVIAIIAIIVAVSTGVALKRAQSSLEETKTTLDKQIDGINEQVKDCDTDLTTQKGNVADLQKKLDQAQVTIDECRKENSVLQDKLMECQKGKGTGTGSTSTSTGSTSTSSGSTSTSTGSTSSGSGSTSSGSGSTGSGSGSTSSGSGSTGSGSGSSSPSTSVTVDTFANIEDQNEGNNVADTITINAVDINRTWNKWWSEPRRAYMVTPVDFSMN